MTRLALIRHGITDWNLDKRIQGRIDQPLGDLGRRQLSSLRVPTEFLDDHWYCSPLQRARETAAILGLHDCHIEPALIEMDWGDWEGEVLKPLRKKLGDDAYQTELIKTVRGVGYKLGPPVEFR